MKPRRCATPPVVLLGLGLLLASCGNDRSELACSPDPRMPLEDRASPYDSVLVTLGSNEMKVCYGRPASRGRTMIGGEYVPYGRLWRTGANEPTVLHTPAEISLAGIPLPPGSYSIYTVPGPEQWEIIANSSTDQWGIESRYTGEVRANEVGRALVAVDPAPEHVETFTIRGESGDREAHLILEWERTRVRVPIREPLE